MSMSDTLGDMITRIRNGQTTKMKKVEAPASRFRKNVLEVLKREGYIRDFLQVEKKPGINFFEIELKYLCIKIKYYLLMMPILFGLQIR